MAAGTAQVVFADPSLVGSLHHLAERRDVFWANSIKQLEVLMQRLFATPGRLEAIHIDLPHHWELGTMLKIALAPEYINPTQL